MIKLTLRTGHFNMLNSSEVSGSLHFRWSEMDYLNLTVTEDFVGQWDVSRDGWEELVLAGIEDYSSHYMVFGDIKEKIQTVRDLFTPEDDDLRIEVEDAQQRFQLVPLLRRLKHYNIPELLVKYAEVL